jgi:GNAT superfamily N-acetyltransferase
MPAALTFRAMTTDDIDAGLRLCRLSHWNQRAEDWQQFLRLTPGGALVAVDAAGLVIGSVATMRYPPSLAWIAMVLVDPARRGGGIGTALLQRGLALVAHDDIVGLDATPLGRPIYEKLGFLVHSSFTRMTRPTAAADGTPAPPGAAARRVRPAAYADRDAIARLDLQATGLDRSAMLAWLHDTAPQLAWVCEGASGLDGVILGRGGHLAMHLGPLVATTTATAVALLSAALSACRDRDVFIDVADSQLEWRLIVDVSGFQPQRAFARMYRGAPPAPAAPGSLFAIIGPEFG